MANPYETSDRICTVITWVLFAVILFFLTRWYVKWVDFALEVQANPAYNTHTIHEDNMCEPFF